MRFITLFSIMFLTVFYSYGQNLIGYRGREIQKYMVENRSDMNSEIVTNTRFRYLKYSDSSDNQTLLFFITSDSICKSVRLICNQNAKAEKVKEFNSIYKPNGENKWSDKRDGKEYRIEIKDDKWSCTITIEPDK